MNIQEYHPLWITRDTDLALEEDEADDLLGDRAGTPQTASRRLSGTLEIEASTPEGVQKGSCGSRFGRVMSTE